MLLARFTCCVLHDWCVFRFVLLICLLAVMAGCMFCCFAVVCCVVYMQNSDWLGFVGVVGRLR